MAAGDKYYRREKIRKWGLIVGGIAAVLAVASFFTQIVEMEGQISEKEGIKVIQLHISTLVIYLSAIAALTGYVLGWWHMFPGGILLVVAGILPAVIDVLPASFQEPGTQDLGPDAAGGPAFIFGIPALVSGVLFLWTRRVEKKIEAAEAKG